MSRLLFTLLLGIAFTQTTFSSSFSNFYTSLQNGQSEIAVQLNSEERFVCATSVRKIDTTPVQVLTDNVADPANDVSDEFYLVQGSFCDDTDSEIILSVSEDKVSGSLCYDGNHYKLDNTELELLTESEHHPDEEADRKMFAKFQQLQNEQGKGRSNYAYNGQTLSPGEVDVFIVIEIDSSFVSTLGGSSAAVRYAVELVDYINTEAYIPIGFNIQVSGVNILSGSVAPQESLAAYNQALINKGKPANAHLVFALTDRFCNGIAGMADMNTLYSDWDRWTGVGSVACMKGFFAQFDSKTLAHEIGHTFGAPESHWADVDECGWECPGKSMQELGLEYGTIMSYCQLCTGGESNVKLEFSEKIVNEYIYESYFIWGVNFDAMNSVTDGAVALGVNGTPGGNPVSTVYGCTDASATNYNPQATNNDGSCTYVSASGCACSGQINSNGNGGSDCSSGYCYTAIGACTDGQSSSYLSNQEYSYQACSNPSTNPTTTVYGCTDSSATNYNSQATSNDGSCTYGGNSSGSCPTTGNYVEECQACVYSTQCIPGYYCCPYMKKCVANSGMGCFGPYAYCPGCSESSSGYPQSSCTADCGNADFPNNWVECGSGSGNGSSGSGSPVYGCTDSSATNYNSQATNDDGSCTYVTGCACAGVNNDQGMGATCASTNNSWCYVQPNSCSDSTASYMTGIYPNYHYSYDACSRRRQLGVLERLQTASTRKL